MSVPSLPAFYNFKYVDKDGNMTPDAHLFNDQTFQVLNSVITANGVVVPTLTAAPVNAAIGTIWFNPTIGAGGALQFMGTSGVQTITSA